MNDSRLKSLMDSLVTDEVKAALDVHLNAQTLLMNPRTGTVQSRALWQQDKDATCSEAFVGSDLIEVKLVDGQWVRVD